MTMKCCKKCDGQGIVDDRGWALMGQPFFDTQTCPKCGGDGLDKPNPAEGYEPMGDPDV